VILGGGVAICSLLSAHRAVTFAIAQLSCFTITAKDVQHLNSRRKMELKDGKMYTCDTDETSHNNHRQQTLPRPPVPHYDELD